MGAASESGASASSPEAAPIHTVYPHAAALRGLVASRPTFRGCASCAHPGYHANGSFTPALHSRNSTKFKVAICTSSTMGFALRKIIEATACGCRVITDLPAGEVMPEIDGNLTRVSSDISLPAA